MAIAILKSKIVAGIIIIGALIFGSYFYSIGKKEVLDDTVRKTAAGSFVQLSRGIIHYEIAGPPGGKPVVLIHGFTTPYFIWDNNFDELVKAGFRVMRFDHFGRGFSDRPAVTYDRDLYDTELLELLDVLEIAKPVHLVGLSMGGGIAVIFTARHPDIVSKVCLLAPAGFPTRELFSMKLGKAPLIGDYIMAVAGDGIILSGIRKAFVKPDRLGEFREKFMVQMRYTGFKRALLSTLRYMHMNDLGELYKQVGQQDKPVLLIWGKEDQLLPYTQSEQVREAIPQVEIHLIEGAGHNACYEFPELVNPLLIRFLKR